ncbi:MAG: hypothetical protein SOU94_09820 [Acidaminococcus sp.]|uniref:Uncharacterized protein n=1 Tax=Acidaminococcus intestini TaxID=187327 RepID=A0A943EF16_9FIRM|nr:hypothetical protein [Acidaminococcus sp.]MBS5520218.1 hypothetical protein [Acidaminococcus intestini]MDY2740102.1 hypothetical protein [Acidaminococcus sp.]
MQPFLHLCPLISRGPSFSFIMGTDIPLKMRDIVIIWFERVVFSILITIPIAMFLGLSD